MMTSLLYALWLSMAQAQESQPVMEVRIPVSKDASVQMLPKIRNKMAEIRVVNCDVDLTDQLKSIRRPGIRSITPINMGEASWLLRLDLINPEAQLRVSVVDGILQIKLYSSEAFQQSDLQEAVSTEDLFNDLFSSGIVLPPDTDLRPLFGIAMAYPMQVRDLSFSTMTLTGDALESEWADVNQARQRYLDVHNQGLDSAIEIGDAAYALGIAYLNEGLAMEADFYLNKLQQNPGRIPPMNIFLAKARADLLQRDWDGARENFQKAYRYGADETLVVEGMAHISHATGMPTRSTTGRLLASLTAKPEALLLAGELLQMDGRYQEAWEVLEPLHNNQMFEDSESSELSQKLRLRLGDIAFLLGDNQQAQLYWRGTYPDIKQVRMIQARMMHEGSSAWVENVPHLRVIAENGDSQNAPEALYLMGQVYSKYGTQLDAVELWAEFVRTYPELTRRTDVLDMLGIAYQDRVRALKRNNHQMRIAKTHEKGWVPELRDVVDSPEIIIAVADAYDQLGLPERALHALISDFGVGSNSGFYMPDAELYLAELYFKSNRYYETHRALQLMREAGMPVNLQAKVDFLEAQTFLAEENLDAAKALFEQTAQTEAFRTQSYVALGILARQEGDCETAVAHLRPTVLPVEGNATDDPLAFLYLSQCLGETGDFALAAEVAEALQLVSSNPDEIQHAQYLQAKFAGPDTVSMQALEDVDSESVWVNLLEEEQKSEDFWAEFEQWKSDKQ